MVIVPFTLGIEFLIGVSDMGTVFLKTKYCLTTKLGVKTKNLLCYF